MGVDGEKCREKGDQWGPETIKKTRNDKKGDMFHWRVINVT